MENASQKLWFICKAVLLSLKLLPRLPLQIRGLRKLKPCTSTNLQSFPSLCTTHLFTPLAPSLQRRVRLLGPGGECCGLGWGGGLRAGGRGRRAQAQMPCHKCPQGGVLGNLGAQGQCGSLAGEGQKKVDKRGEGFLAEGTMFAKITRHRSLGNCRLRRDFPRGSTWGTVAQGKMGHFHQPLPPPLIVLIVGQSTSVPIMIVL